MRMLIVEDDPHKSNELEAFVCGQMHFENVTRCDSVNSAVRVIDNNFFDLVLLDMALPSHHLRPGNGPAVSLLSGGLEIVMELDYQKRNEPIIILTQHIEVEINEKLIPVRSVKAELLRQFSVNLIDCIRYEYGKDSWKSKLVSAIEAIK